MPVPPIPKATDALVSDTLCDGGFDGYGCWNFTRPAAGADARGRRARGGRPVMPNCDCTPAESDGNHSFLAGMVQRVVAAII